MIVVSEPSFPENVVLAVVRLLFNTRIPLHEESVPVPLTGPFQVTGHAGVPSTMAPPLGPTVNPILESDETGVLALLAKRLAPAPLSVTASGTSVAGLGRKDGSGTIKRPWLITSLRV